ncbi:hypothetical protein BD560DRAFT_428658, partial [Blakeslea trispora]
KKKESCEEHASSSRSHVPNNPVVRSSRCLLRKVYSIHKKELLVHKVVHFFSKPKKRKDIADSQHGNIEVNLQLKSFPDCSLFVVLPNQSPRLECLCSIYCIAEMT